MTSVPALRSRYRRLLVDEHGLQPMVFGLAAVALGAAAGCGAWVFRALIALVHNAAFLRMWSSEYDTNQHTPESPWGWGVMLVPVLGAFLVVWLVKSFAPEAKGHGVPEVMDAIYYQKSRIRPVVAVVKSLASAVSIGTGGSVGREGPIIQIGAAVGSMFGRLASASRWQCATLVAAGGGAGIAATFNTPIGGVLFAVEILLHEVSVRTLVPVALATTTATFVGRALFGNTPAIPLTHAPSPGSAAALPLFVVLGVLMALASALFIRALYKAEDLFEERIPEHPYLRHGLGMLFVGITFTWLLHATGHYYVQGVGYAAIVDALNHTLANVWLLVAVAALKLLTTCLTLGSGASGGVFSPSLVMGATLGAAYGLIVNALWPSLGLDPAVCALVGMAALVAGATGAALTAVVMIFEMTLDYTVILPLTLAAAVSYGFRRLIVPQSIYTMKLVRRGHVMPEALQANAHLIHHIAEIALGDVSVLPQGAPPEQLRLDEQGPSYYVLVDGSSVVGLLSRYWALAHPGELKAARALNEVMERDVVAVPADSTIFDLMTALQHARAEVAIVLGPHGEAPHGAEPGTAPPVIGVVTKAHLAEALAEGMELFED